MWSYLEKVLADIIKLRISNEIILDYPGEPHIPWKVSLEGEETQRGEEGKAAWGQRQKLDF